ncbi:glycosyltransferase family 2 protein [Clostridium uliginosum]|uniref:Glycosyltransferase involved in cell wall bisynthesis n=1 Tax=Clostridium uliginosum TaxID=119641 RepID=A0A1I1QWE5_9CLOT|nr:glycosyltransferase family 2 protein [Clostridium uliginosum]SFD26322.1 Glycosyltransferase involved in cell wall bisynthesis [Clostridium uliginosum]
MKNLVSVIIPVYNSSKTIEKTIKSVLCQSYTCFEIIIIDDCSTDNSFEIIENLSESDSRIILYRNQKNLGVAKTRNLGINMTKGEFISFLDSDDIWKSSKLEKQLEYIKQKNAHICYTSYEMINNNETNCVVRVVPKEINYNGLLKENVICCSTAIVKSYLLKKYPFETEFFHEDFVLWLKLLKCGFKAIGIQETLVIYRKGGRSSDKLNACKNRWVIYRKSEELGLILSMYYFVCYTINGIKKYYLL